MNASRWLSPTLRISNTPSRARRSRRPAQSPCCRAKPTIRPYMSAALPNPIVAIPDATTRAARAGTGRTVTKDGLVGATR
jgi:hypothetical protein